MFWTGETKWSFWHIFKKIPGEIIQGLKDNIPPCCVAWYTLTKLMTMIPTAIVRTILREKKVGEGFSFDFYVMWRMFGGKYKLTKKGEREFQVSRFWKLQYFRCPLCRLARFERKLRWDTGSYWDWCGPYKSYYKTKYKERKKNGK